MNRRDFLTCICFNPIDEKQENLGTYPEPFWTITKKMTGLSFPALCKSMQFESGSVIKPAKQECVPSVLPAELLSQLQLLRLTSNQSCVYSHHK